MNTNLPPAPDGALIYTHPQGKTVYVLTDGSMVCYKPDGKRGTTSATPAKLEAGHGGWELQEAPSDARLNGARRQNAADEALVVAGRVNMERLATAPSAYGLAPQLAESADIDALKFFVTNPRIVIEQKLDGDRVMFEWVDGVLVARTRNGSLYTKGLPTAVRNHSLPPGIILDGELVGSGTGRVFWAFDLPVAPHVTGEPLYVRRAALEALRDAGALGPIRVVPQARTMDEKHALTLKAMSSGFEGLMAKKVDAIYLGGGRTTDWLKVKFTKTADVVVIPKKKEDGHDSVALGVFDADGNEVEVGRSSLIGKGDITVGDVIEVRYLYVGANGRLYQPTILRKRWDKRADECLTTQLVHVNKSVLEELV